MGAHGGLRRAALATTAALVVVAAALGVLDATGRLPEGLAGGAGPSATPTASLDPARSRAPAVLAPEPTSAGPVPTLPLADLRAALRAPALGGSPGVTVLDVATGQVLLAQDPGTARVPASVAKLATVAAALQALGPDRRLVTTAVAGPGSEVVLVGAGDASLAGAPSGPGDLPRRASLAGLADRLVPALRSAGTTGPVTVRVDDTLFAGPRSSPHWPASYLSAGVVARVSALSVDQGRVRPDAEPRVPDPALAAGAELARLLRRRGVQVTGPVTRGRAPADAPVLASVQSPTVAELVELTLRTSDNDLAEALARLTALATGEPATFAGATAAVVAQLQALGVPTEGVRLLDGSGLARGSAIPPVALARLLVLAADGSHPVLAPVVEGLPVAGFSGTLATRFGSGPTRAGAGVVRAKTGTLTGVSSLAGTTSVSGRPVVFVAMSDQVPDDATLQARADLDRFAALLASAPAQRSPAAAGG